MQSAPAVAQPQGAKVKNRGGLQSRLQYARPACWRLRRVPGKTRFNKKMLQIYLFLDDNINNILTLIKKK